MIRQVVTIAGEDMLLGLRSAQYRLGELQLGSQPNRVLVNGSPKSGTTWMVRLLATIPGYRRVGNYRGDLARFSRPPPGAVIHGHEPYTRALADVLAENEIRVILMVRDPRDQMVSRLYHIRRDASHRWHKRMNELSDDEALLHCIEGGPDLEPVTSLITLVQGWQLREREHPVICVQYERLLANPIAEFRRTLDFLNVKIRQNLLEAIVHRNRFERLAVGKRIWKQPQRPGEANPSSHFRKGIVGDWKNYFGESHRARFKELAGHFLIEMGYEHDLNW
jgi:sulfotransferase 6B1